MLNSEYHNLYREAVQEQSEMEARQADAESLRKELFKREQLQEQQAFGTVALVLGVLLGTCALLNLPTFLGGMLFTCALLTFVGGAYAMHAAARKLDESQEVELQ